MLVFQQAYDYIGRKLNLPHGFDTLYWKRYANALVHLELVLFHYDTDTVLEQLCTKMNSLIDEATDPLDFVGYLRTHSGNPLSKQQKELNNQSFNFSKPKGRTNYHKKKYIDPEKCKYCKKNICNIKKHNIYWLRKLKG